jgi:dienelactone hydrolase
VPRRRRLFALLAFGIAAVVLLGEPAARRLCAAELLLALSASHAPGGEARPQAELVEEELELPSTGGPIRARLYRRADRARAPGLVIAHGVHYKGIDERRLIPFARELARSGRVVLTPELDDLVDYRITRRGLRVIEESVLYLASRRDRVSSTRVGLLGFSFAGGLSLVAASEPVLRGRLSYATSVGGHHDLGRVLRFLATNEIPTPGGALRTPAHEYGLVVLLHGSLDRFVPAEDRALLSDALRAWLHGDRDLALQHASRRVTAEGERIYLLLASERLQELAPDLLRLVDEHASELAELSPAGRLAGAEVPIYLLHGSADSVIPPSETEWAGRELGPREHAALVSPLLEHVEVSQSASWLHELALVDFMARML